MEAYFPTPRVLLKDFETDSVMMAVINRIWGHATHRCFTWTRREMAIQLRPGQLFFCAAEIAKKFSYAQSTVKDKLARLRRLGRITWEVVKNPKTRQIEGLVVTILEAAGEPVESGAASGAATPEEEPSFQDVPILNFDDPARLPATDQDEVERKEHNTNPTHTRACAQDRYEPLGKTPEVDVGLEEKIKHLSSRIEEACPHLEPTPTDRMNFRDQMLAEAALNGSLEKQERGLKQLEDDPVLAASTTKLTRISHMAEAMRAEKTAARRSDEFRYVSTAVRDGMPADDIVYELTKGLATFHPLISKHRLIAYCKRLVDNFARV